MVVILFIQRKIKRINIELQQQKKKSFCFTGILTVITNRFKESKTMQFNRRYMKSKRWKLPEESFQILWQFSTASIPRVHCNENSNSWFQDDVLSQEIKPLLLGLDGILDTLDLDSNH